MILESHNIFLSKVLNKNLMLFYQKYPDIKISIRDNYIYESLAKLAENKIDIIINKKYNFDNKSIIFIHLGYLNDILVAKKESKMSNKQIDINTLYNSIFYVPSINSGSTKHFFETVNCQKELFNNLNYTTHDIILSTLKNTGDDLIALTAREFIEEELNKGQIIELNTNIKIPPTEYGIYINKNNRFKELNLLIDLLK